MWREQCQGIVRTGQPWRPLVVLTRTKFLFYPMFTFWDTFGEKNLGEKTADRFTSSPSWYIGRGPAVTPAMTLLYIVWWYVQSVS